MNPDYMNDVLRHCEDALKEASTRPLTDEEITALRFAAGIPEGRAAARERGKQENFEWQ